MKFFDRRPPEYEFWRWFESIEAKLKDSCFPLELGWDLSNQLAKVHPGIGWSKGHLGETTILTFTANGSREVAEYVKRLVKAAPSTLGWEFEAFRGPEAIDLEEEYDYLYEGDLSFELLRKREDGTADIKVFVRGMTAENGTRLSAGAGLLLEAVLGEEVFMFSLGEVEYVSGLSEDRSGRPIDELPRCLANEPLSGLTSLLRF